MNCDAVGCMQCIAKNNNVAERDPILSLQFSDMLVLIVVKKMYDKQYPKKYKKGSCKEPEEKCNRGVP